jgi:hypothetical protein
MERKKRCRFSGKCAMFNYLCDEDRECGIKDKYEKYEKKVKI